MALQHAGGPHPVEEHSLQIFGVLRGCVRFGHAAAWIWILSAGGHRRADCEDDSDREPDQTRPSTNIHDGPPTIPMEHARPERRGQDQYWYALSAEGWT